MKKMLQADPVLGPLLRLATDALGREGTSGAGQAAMMMTFN